MPRIRISTTVEEQSLLQARALRVGIKDAALFDEALVAFVAQHRAVEIDAAYAIYDDQPLSDADEWGDLESFREAAGRK